MGWNKLHTTMKVLAILALAATVLGAGVVLYAVRTMTPQVERVQIAVTPAEQAQETFDAAIAQVQRRTFTGRVFSDAEGLDAQDCSLLTYTVRLRNGGFFPAEWITLTVEPRTEGDGRDVLQLPDDGGRVLPAMSEGDLTASVLRAGDAADTARTLHLVCYVLGQEIAFDVQAQ